MILLKTRYFPNDVVLSVIEEHPELDAVAIYHREPAPRIMGVWISAKHGEAFSNHCLNKVRVQVTPTLGEAMDRTFDPITRPFGDLVLWVVEQIGKLVAKIRSAR